MDYLIRDMRNEEFSLLEDFLFEAIFVPEGFEGEISRVIIGDGYDASEWLMVHETQSADKLSATIGQE